MESRFDQVRRQKFRDWFQPSRIIILSIFDGERGRFNLTTLCFSMHSAYKPPSIAFAVEKRHLSHFLLQQTKKFVLAIPGRDLADVALRCGLVSGREVDKAQIENVQLENGASKELGLISHAIANIECELIWAKDSGDHTVFNSRVDRYLVSPHTLGPGLVSIGSVEAGYEVLRTSGVHRLAIPKLLDR
jgi:flavin reductase (DIM6/NTAB) family NADH-FMN oxidoreductase RutF